MITFTIRGIGTVTVRRGETRQQAERRARREHGRKTTRRSIVLPGIGTVKPRARESFDDAIKRARKEHAELSQRGKDRAAAEISTPIPGGKVGARRKKKKKVRIVAFERDPRLAAELFDDRAVAEIALPIIVGSRRRRVKLRVRGRVLKSPDFVQEEPFDRIFMLEVDGIDDKFLDPMLREILGATTPDAPVIEEISFV